MDRSKILCKSCLSGDRKLSVVEGMLLDLFLYLSGAKTKIATDIGCVALCWECVALLKATQRFQNRIRSAQAVLKSFHLLLKTQKVSCLSTLSTTVCGDPISFNYEETLPITVIPDAKKQDGDNQYSCSEVILDIIPKEENFDTYQNNSGIKYEIHHGDMYSDSGPLHDCVEGTDDKINDQNNLTVEGTNEAISIKIKREDGEVKPIISIKKGLKRKRQKYRNTYKAEILENTDLDAEDLNKHCTKSYLNDEELNIRLTASKKGKPKKVRCGSCDARFTGVLDQRMHQTFAHMSLTTPPYECLHCKASVRSLPELESHWREHCSILRCNYCGVVLRQAKLMRRHLMSHSRIYRCRDCSATFYSQTDYRTHHKALHRQLTCDHCKRIFRSKQTIAKHISHLHLPNKCPHCPRVFPTHKKFLQHALKSHQLRPEPCKLEQSYCVECDKQFPTVAKYRAHVKEAFAHSKKKRQRTRASCPLCGKVFSRRQYMANHYALHHQGSTRHHCAPCDKYFLTAYLARRHRLSYHEGVTAPKNKICDICGRGFSSNRILTHHRRTHTGERPYPCEHCSAAFAQRTALLTHQRTQHKLQRVKDEAKQPHPDAPAHTTQVATCQGRSLSNRILSHQRTQHKLQHVKDEA